MDGDRFIKSRFVDGQRIDMQLDLKTTKSNTVELDIFCQNRQSLLVVVEVKIPKLRPQCLKITKDFRNFGDDV